LGELLISFLLNNMRGIKLYLKGLLANSRYLEVKHKVLVGKRSNVIEVLLKKSQKKLIKSTL